MKKYKWAIASSLLNKEMVYVERKTGYTVMFLNITVRELLKGNEISL